MSDDKTWLFPAFCEEGKHLVTVNMYDHPRHCPDGHAAEPVPYTDEFLIDEPGAEIVVDWGWLDPPNCFALTDGTYFCPACQQYTLRFRNGREMWD